MARIHFLTAEGQSLQFDAHDGMSVMEVAVAHNVPGIDADCGGACACATCHVYVDPAWAGKLPAKTDLEQKMLEFATEVTSESRLCCRLTVGPSMDGLKLTVPPSQF